MSATGDTPGLTTTSSPDGEARRRRRRRRRRRPSTSQPGTCGSGGFGSPRVTHRSMWLRALATTRMRTSSAPSSGGSIVAPPVAAGRLVQDPGVQRSSSSDVHGGGVGLDGDAQRAYGAPPTPSTHSPSGRSNCHAPLRRPAGADRRVRHVGAGRQPPPRLPARPHAHRGVDLDDVGPPVVGVGPRGDVPATRGGRRSSRPRSGPATRAHRRSWTTTWATATSARPSASTRRTSIGNRCSPAPVRRSAERAQQVAADAAAPADVVARSRSGGERRRRWRHRRGPAGTGTASPHVSPGRIVIRRPVASAAGPVAADDAVGDDAPERPLGDLPRPAGASPASGRDERHLAGQVDELLHRAHEVAAGHCSSATTSARSSPSDPGVGGGDETRVGRAVLAEAGRALVGGEVLARGDDAAPAVADVRRREPRRRRRLGAAVLVDEHRQQPGERRRVEPVEQAVQQALGDEQVGLVEHPRQHRRRGRSGPTRPAST